MLNYLWGIAPECVLLCLTCVTALLGVSVHYLSVQAKQGMCKWSRFFILHLTLRLVFWIAWHRIQPSMNDESEMMWKWLLPNRGCIPKFEWRDEKLRATPTVFWTWPPRIDCRASLLNEALSYVEFCWFTLSQHQQQIVLQHFPLHMLSQYMPALRMSCHTVREKMSCFRWQYINFLFAVSQTGPILTFRYSSNSI